ncbi:VanW family protein [Lutispora thermophila]|uniref:Vancomycin resistance protein YoaR, contains peptidoglycan-binding and VanW domains n=1 Tax=Lutispora thermophila DSM 19022 TaxID=1122184 RepID=A0A1M6FXT0_9FIRM|nr:VanW family protein [Lutispora thermophila]SHJ02474.1 Vancomycin resistance protein YoaR, contains peptidoglycan-binding and VanW domains [Lutispora thermophila DSM 19022]
MAKGYKGIIIGLISFVIALIVGSAVLFLSGDKIAPNVFIDGYDVGRITMEEAAIELKNAFDDNLSEAYMILKYGEKTWQLNYKDIDYSYDYEKALAKAYSITRQGNIFKRYVDSILVRMNKVDIPIGFSYNEQKIAKLISDISKEIDSEPIDATIRLISGKFQITDEKLGSKLNQEKAVEMVSEAIEKKSIADIELPVEVINAEITREDLSNITDKLGEYATSFNSANESRTYNIKLATKSVTDVLVRPGETFSLNKTIGPRLAKYGYRTAKVIINNEYVDGIGGGVCQVSSTLYNAALLANLKIVERKNHSLPSSYIAMGRDATISGDYIDFKFMNNTPYPIYIYGEVKGNQVRFSIYGKNENKGRQIKIKTEILKKIEPKIKIIEDSSLPVGTRIVEKKAIPGYVVRSYRVIVENGKEVLVEPLYTDTYRASDGVTRVGTKPVSRSVEEEAKTVEN